VSHRVPIVTRDAVLGAIARCDQLGVERFVAAYGYCASKRFVVRHAGRSYPSKAILGVAAGLTARDFSGGAAHTCRVLGRLGFTIREGSPRGLDATLARLALGLSFVPTDYSPPVIPNLPIEPVAYFASGSNHAGEIRALADLGHDVGVSARELGPSGEAELMKLAGTDVLVFVDSGAFAEMDFRTGAPVLVAPMSDRTWARVFALYFRLALVLGDQLQVVAPDRVGCQATTRARLALYRDQLRALHAMGVRILLPVQRGALTQAAFYRECCELLGFAPIPALPCKKAATSPTEAGAFAHEIAPAQLHLLGIGRGATAADFLTAIVEASPDTQVQMDAVVITSLAGRTNGRGHGPRVLTAANDLAVQLARSYDCLATVAARKYLGLVLALGGVGVLS
jgi:hypothetical protein